MSSNTVHGLLVEAYPGVPDMHDGPEGFKEGCRRALRVLILWYDGLQLSLKQVSRVAHLGRSNNSGRVEAGCPFQRVKLSRYTTSRLFHRAAITALEMNVRETHIWVISKSWDQS